MWCSRERTQLEVHGVRREVGYHFVMIHQLALAFVTVGGLIESIAMSSR